MVQSIRSDSVELIEQTLNEYRQLLGKIPGGALHNGPDLKWAWTGRSHLNMVFNARLAEEDVQDRIAQLQAYFSQRRIMYVNWLICPLSQPEGLDRLLVQHYGAHAIDGQASVQLNGMTLDPDQLVDTPAPSPSVTIDTVQQPEDLKTWLDLAVDHPVRREVMKLLIETFSISLDQPLINAYLCRDEGKPVGTALFFVGEKAASLRNVFVREEARGKGLGRWISWYVLNTCRNRRKSTVITDATPAGARVYRALGFRDCCPLYEYAVRIPEVD